MMSRPMTRLAGSMLAVIFLCSLPPAYHSLTTTSGKRKPDKFKPKAKEAKKTLVLEEQEVKHDPSWSGDEAEDEGAAAAGSPAQQSWCGKIRNNSKLAQEKQWRQEPSPRSAPGDCYQLKWWWIPVPAVERKNVGGREYSLGVEVTHVVAHPSNRSPPPDRRGPVYESTSLAPRISLDTLLHQHIVRSLPGSTHSNTEFHFAGYTKTGGNTLMLRLGDKLLKDVWEGELFILVFPKDPEVSEVSPCSRRSSQRWQEREKPSPKRWRSLEKGSGADHVMGDTRSEGGGEGGRAEASSSTPESIHPPAPTEKERSTADYNASAAVGTTDEDLEGPGEHQQHSSMVSMNALPRGPWQHGVFYPQESTDHAQQLDPSKGWHGGDFTPSWLSRRPRCETAVTEPEPDPEVEQLAPETENSWMHELQESRAHVRSKEEMLKCRETALLVGDQNPWVGGYSVVDSNQCREKELLAKQVSADQEISLAPPPGLHPDSDSCRRSRSTSSTGTFPPSPRPAEVSSGSDDHPSTSTTSTSTRSTQPVPSPAAAANASSSSASPPQERPQKGPRPNMAGFQPFPGGGVPSPRILCGTPPETREGGLGEYIACAAAPYQYLIMRLQNSLAQMKRKELDEAREEDIALHVRLDERAGHRDHCGSRRENGIVNKLEDDVHEMTERERDWVRKLALPRVADVQENNSPTQETNRQQLRNEKRLSKSVSGLLALEDLMPGAISKVVGEEESKQIFGVDDLLSESDKKSRLREILARQLALAHRTEYMALVDELTADLTQFNNSWLHGLADGGEEEREDVRGILLAMDFSQSWGRRGRSDVIETIVLTLKSRSKSTPPNKVVDTDTHTQTAPTQEEVVVLAESSNLERDVENPPLVAPTPRTPFSALAQLGVDSAFKAEPVMELTDLQLQAEGAVPSEDGTPETPAPPHLNATQWPTLATAARPKSRPSPHSSLVASSSGSAKLVPPSRRKGKSRCSASPQVPPPSTDRSVASAATAVGDEMAATTEAGDSVPSAEAATAPNGENADVLSSTAPAVQDQVQVAGRDDINGGTGVPIALASSISTEPVAGSVEIEDASAKGYVWPQGHGVIFSDDHYWGTECQQPWASPSGPSTEDAALAHAVAVDAARRSADYWYQREQVDSGAAPSDWYNPGYHPGDPEAGFFQSTIPEQWGSWPPAWEETEKCAADCPHQAIGAETTHHPQVEDAQLHGDNGLLPVQQAPHPFGSFHQLVSYGKTLERNAVLQLQREVRPISRGGMLRLRAATGILDRTTGEMFVEHPFPSNLQVVEYLKIKPALKFSDLTLMDLLVRRDLDETKTNNHAQNYRYTRPLYSEAARSAASSRTDDAQEKEDTLIMFKVQVAWGFVPSSDTFKDGYVGLAEIRGQKCADFKFHSAGSFLFHDPNAWERGMFLQYDNILKGQLARDVFSGTAEDMRAVNVEAAVFHDLPGSPSIPVPWLKDQFAPSDHGKTKGSFLLRSGSARKMIPLPFAALFNYRSMDSGVQAAEQQQRNRKLHQLSEISIAQGGHRTTPAAENLQAQAEALQKDLAWDFISSSGTKGKWEREPILFLELSSGPSGTGRRETVAFRFVDKQGLFSEETKGSWRDIEPALRLQEKQYLVRLDEKDTTVASYDYRPGHGDFQRK